MKEITLESQVADIIQNKEMPNCARTFAINYSYKIEEGDQILFFNYCLYFCPTY